MLLLPSAAEPVASVRHIEPAAQERLDSMVSAYRKLKTFSCEITREIKSGERPASTRQVSLKYQKPRKLSWIVRDVENTEVVDISDGTNLFRYRPTTIKDKYWQIPLTGKKDDEAALIPLLIGGDYFSMVLHGVDPLTSVGETAPLKVTLGESSTINGEAVDVVAVESKLATGVSRQIYYIGKSDSLLRRLEFLAGDDYSEIETHSSLRQNPVIPAATFVFKSPPGVSKIQNKPAEPDWDPRLKKGALPLAIKGRDSAGKKLSLQQYKGKVVLISFWASWCMPCHDEQRNIKLAYDKYNAQGFEVLGISLDEDRTQMDSYLQQYNIPWRQYFDGKKFKGAIVQQYGVKYIPFAVLVGRDGKIAALSSEAARPLLDENIQKALAQPR